MDEKEERNKIIISSIIPLCIILAMWIVKFIESTFKLDFGALGVLPQTVKGLIGIPLMPFLHANWQHLTTNSVPIFVLGTALYYCYKPIANHVILLTYVFSGLLTWCIGGSGTHIGASALVYGLNIFLIISGFIRRDSRLIAISFIMIFLYGSFIWGVIPEFTEPLSISWEGHLSGLISGLILAIYYRKDGPQREQHIWGDEDEDDVDENDELEADAEKPYWDVPQPDKDELDVRYRFRK
jgi:Uncharacterized membrane protein (homolog of Drosophila rhomboid)